MRTSAISTGRRRGGRQAYSLAQNLPDDYDGIIGNMPAINFTQFVTAGAYAQLLFLHDLGGKPISEAQQDKVGTAAIAACDVVGGQHVGYIMDMGACHYDPTKDAAILCAGDGGRSDDRECVTRKQAAVFNKIWYGLTPDGSVPAPAVDNGWKKPVSGFRRWYGLPRGTSLYNHYFSNMYKVNAGQASVSGAWTLATDMIALSLQNPRMASPSFTNAKGNGADLWKTLTYAQLATAVDREVEMDPLFSHASTDNPDLSAFKARGGKLLTWHGLNDEMIPVQGTIQYYDSVLRKMGGVDQVQSFYRLYLLPGNGHGSPNGTTNLTAQPPLFGPGQFYRILMDWVEKGVAPGKMDIASPAGSAAPISQPVCLYPAKAVYRSGDPKVAASYTCSKLR